VLRAIILVCVADAVAGASFGALTVSGGLPAWVPVAMSVFIFAGGAQFAAAGVVLAGGSPAAAVLAGLLLNARILPYGFTVADAVGSSWWTRLLGAHLIVDETVAFTERHDHPQGRRAAFLISGLALFLCWNVAVALGALAGAAMPDPGRFGLDAAYPTVLLALVLPSLGGRRVRDAALIGAVIAVAATPFVPAGLPVLLALIGLAAAGRRADTTTRDRCPDLRHVRKGS
jgi:4-azaleucine resistance transporter AzlC